MCVSNNECLSELEDNGTRKDVSLTRFTGKYIKGNWDFFFSLFDKKGQNSKFIQTSFHPVSQLDSHFLRTGIIFREGSVPFPEVKGNFFTFIQPLCQRNKARNDSRGGGRTGFLLG